MPLRTYVAGIMFEERFVYAQELTLSHRLCLKRQPDNLYDSNAIQVIHLKMGQIGFLPRQMAALLASRMDVHQIELEARVIELLQEPTNQQVKVQIEFNVPVEWLTLSKPVPTSSQSAIIYHIQPSTTATATYLLLNCTVDQLLNVRDMLPSNGFEVSRSGYSTWPAANGIQYEWYIRLPSLTDPDTKTVTQLLEKRFGAISEEQNRNQLDDLTKTYQREVALMDEKLRKAEQEKREALHLGVEAEIEKQREVDFLKGRLEQLKSDHDHLKHQAYELRHEKDSLSQSLLSRDAEKVPFGIEVERAFVKVAAESLTPQQSLDVIHILFADRIVVLPSALKSAGDSEVFRYRARLFNLLWRLAKEYWPRLISGHGDTDARAIFGDDFAARESETTETNKTARQHREFDYNGQLLSMQKHLRIGVKDSNYETIRIHFEWVADDQKIVIGYCGPHLPLR